ncbi:MAG TPA: trehalose-6-phosphate synthase [Candidatus Omnitrophota bacterium]|nr:trehalose-6-phosphate synthase [Candidatus Omnitrophota bacterium]
MWTKQDLEKLVKEKMADYHFVIVSNAQPYVHVLNKGQIECQRGVGGVISTLDPILQACRGTWVAFGNGDADRHVTDIDGRLKVPENDPRYTLKRIWLTKEEKQGYYYGYSNEVLWPLCHMAFQRPAFREEDWKMYQQVNEKFAKSVVEEIGDKKAFVWIQDYHLCLLPKLLKEMAPKQTVIAHFWHIPWPNYEAFRICPQRHEILEGLLANDLLGFHIRYHCNNFFDVVDREIESKIDRERFSVIKNEHETLIRPYPIGVDIEGISQAVESPAVRQLTQSLKEEYKLAGMKVLVGLDRIDYTKGIPEKMRAIDLLLQRYPQLKEKIVLFQVGVVNRLHIKNYKLLNDEINSIVEEINWRHSTGDWKPIIFFRQHFSLPKVLALYRMADVMLVSSLHDGMNLVAKEFVASRSDEEGMLVLSQFTGAARELTEAVLVNPFDGEQFCEGIYKALSMPSEERKKRMGKMREALKSSNIFRWAGKIISELLKFEFQEHTASR